MSEEFTHQVLRAVIGRVCQPLGVHGMHQSVCDCMADVLKQYILTLGRTTSSYCAHANRTEPNLSDVFQAFRDLGINLSELEEFTKEVESVPLPEPIPQYPIPRDSTHIHHAPSGGKPAAASHRSRTGSLSSEDECDRDHIPPYLPPLPLEAEEQKEDGEEQEMADQSEMASEAVPMDTRPPLDPMKGLPQLFRSRRLSSDFSEDGESASSRRNSISNGVPLRTPSAPAESGLINTIDNRGIDVAGKDVVDSVVLVKGEAKAPSPSADQKVNVFDVAFSKKLSETRERQEPAEAIQQVVPSQEPADKAGETPLPTLSKPVKQEIQVPQPTQPVVFHKPQQPVATQTRVLPPPLKLMSPTSAEHPNTNLPTQQPPLSPLTTRSPVQIAGMPRMPVLSPLRTPTSANRHPMRMSGGYCPTAGSPLLSPPTLRSPVDSTSLSGEPHIHSGLPPSTASVPRMHLPPLPSASQIPFSAHPPSQPFSAQSLQVQATAAVSDASQASLVSTLAVSPEDSTLVQGETLVPKEEVPISNSPRQLTELDEDNKEPTNESLKDGHLQLPLQDIPLEQALSVSSSSTSSSPASPKDMKEDSENVPLASPPEKDTASAKGEEEEEDLASPRSLEEGQEGEVCGDVSVSQTERLSASPISGDENIVSLEHSPAGVATTGETSLKDLEISDDEGLSDEEEEEEGEDENGEEERASSSKPLSPARTPQSDAQGEQDESFLSESNIAPTPASGKKLVKKEMALSPISSPGSEFDSEAKLGDEEEVDFSTQEALSLVQVSKEERDETEEEEEEEIDAEKEELLSPENLPTVSSEDETGETVASDQPIMSPRELEESRTKGQEEVVEREPDVKGTKVKVLDSAGASFRDDRVQDMGTVEEVLEVLEQKLSSDEESEETGEEEEKGELGGEGGVASEIGVVSGEGVIVEEEDDMVETLSAMVTTPQPATVTTESISVTSKAMTREEVLGIKPAPPPRQALPKSLKVSISRQLVASLRPEPKKPPAPTPPPPTTVSRFLTKAEKKADIASLHFLHHQQQQYHHGHGRSGSTVTSAAAIGGGGGGGGLIVTPGETKTLTPPVPRTPSVSPTPPPEDEQDHQSMIISINRRLLRHSRFGVPTPVEERSRLPTANALKMRLARFGAGLAPPTGSAATGHVTATPSLNPRKRDRDSDSGTTLTVGREVKRSRQESPPIELPSHQRQVSSSSSSSSSSSDDEEESGSDESVSRSPSPFRHPPPPAPPTSSVVTATPPPPVGATRSKLHPHSSLLHAQTQRHHPHHHLSQHQLHRSHTPSSVDDEEEDEEDIDNEEETRALTPASNDSGSTVGSVGGGLKLTISKAVLKQAALSQHKASVSAVSSPSLPTTLFIGSPTDTGGRGSGRGSKGSRRGRGGGGKRGRRSSASTKPVTTSLSVKSSQPKKVKRKDLAGATKPSSSKTTPVQVQIQSSSPVIITVPGSRGKRRRSSKSGRDIISSLPTAAATAPAVGSDYHCPECGLRDDGSPMIGCDGCDSWLHWTCVGITREPPADEEWFCPTCVKSRQAGKKKKGRKRKRTN